MSNKKKKKKKGKIALIVAGSVIGLVLIAAVVGVSVIIHYINKMNYVPLNENYTVLAETPSYEEDVTNPEEETSKDSSQGEIDEYQSISDSILESQNERPDDIGDVYNILLIGSDTRNSNDRGRSDTMLLISINRNLKRIVATSFLRDLYVNIPDRGYDKINAAYAYGGIELLLDTLEYNFSLEIDKYISVDFYSFIKVVDILGGLDVDVQKDELHWLNEYIHASNLLMKMSDEYDGYLSYADGSYQHLNGRQTLAYARFRYVGNGDFTRTERQRKVVYLLFEKLKSIDADTLIKLLDEILPEITTNVPTDEWLSLITILPSLGSYDIKSWGVPDEDFKYITIDGISHIGIDFDFYINKIYNLIYNEE